MMVFDLIFNSIEGSISNLFEAHWLSYGGGIILVLLIFMRLSYFSFEVDHEIIHIVSKSLLFGAFQSKRDINFEFPKRNLSQLQLKNSAFGPLLFLSLETQHGAKSTQRFKLSFLSKSETDSILSSLNEIAANNNSK